MNAAAAPRAAEPYAALRKLLRRSRTLLAECKLAILAGDRGTCERLARDVTAHRRLLYALPESATRKAMAALGLARARLDIRARQLAGCQPRGPHRPGPHGGKPLLTTEAA